MIHDFREHKQVSLRHTRAEGEGKATPSSGGSALTFAVFCSFSRFVTSIFFSGSRISLSRCVRFALRNVVPGRSFFALIDGFGHAPSAM